MTAVPVFQEVGIPMITPQAGQVDVTLTGNYIFRMCTIASFEGNLIARRMIEDGCQNLAVIYSNDDYGVNILETWSGVVEDGLPSSRLRRLFRSDERLHPTPFKSRPPVRTRSTRARIPDAAMIVTQMAQLDCNFRSTATPCSIRRNFWTQPAATPGHAFGLHQPQQHRREFAFIKEAYETATGNLTDMYVLNSYDAITALRRGCCRRTRPPCHGRLDRQRRLAGASGVINFDENRNPIKDMFWYVIENNEFVLAD
ncbi:MAG: hypothetical protein ACLUI3_02840 [Christensenellales bacterium]